MLPTTDPLGNPTTVTYDGHGNFLTLTDPLGHITTRTYDSFSRLSAQTDALGRRTHFSYDPLNYLTSRGTLFPTLTYACVCVQAFRDHRPFPQEDRDAPAGATG